MPISCPECGDEFDTEHGLHIHMDVEHPEEVEDETVLPSSDLGERFVDIWQQPRVAFLLGALLGIVVVGSILFAPQSVFLEQDPSAVGEKVLSHYRAIAPPTVTYQLAAASTHPSGIYEIQLEVSSGTHSNIETIYVTSDSKWVFEATPERIKADISTLE